MRSVLKYAGIALLLMVTLEACTALPGATAPAATPVPVTSAPAVTEAPGSTEAAPLAGGAATEPASSTVSSESAAAAPTTASETAPACTPGSLTPAQTEGPYYKANPPESSTLLQPGMGGTKLTITGYVLDEQCKPVPGARVDFWQADSEGQYDNQGYALRGYQITDAQGRYSVETVVPGLYPGRTRHIHVKITPPSGRTLTTQLYFPGEQANASDQIFSPQLIMSIQKTRDGETGTFNFVVSAQ